VLWEQNPHVSSDYIASLRDKVQAETAAPCLALVGAIGGMMTPDVEEHTFDEAQLLGHALADAALGALSLRPTAPVERLEHRRQAYSLPLANPLFEMAIASGLIPNLLDEQGRLSTEANLLKIGPVWLLGVPGELLPRLGLDCKALMLQAGAKIAAIMGLTNDELGYILPQEDYVYPDNPFEPGEHYEETMSTGPDAGPRLLDALHELLNRSSD
jgi:hypothetical protein